MSNQDATPDHEALLAELIDELVERKIKGRAIDWPTIEAEHPDLAAEARRLLPLASRVAATCDVAAAEMGVVIPEKLAQYRLTDELGRGGNGRVYKAVDENLQREVAIKVLVEHDPIARRRFLREAQSLARLNHANVVPVFDAGSDRNLEYLVMALVPGGSLADRLKNAPKDAFPDLGQSDTTWPSYQLQAVRLVAEAARALHHAHERSLLHRDIKPGNLMLNEANQCLVADFGLAARRDTDSTIINGVGTLRYLAPECLHGEPHTESADVFGLGATLYELLARSPMHAQREVSKVQAAVGAGDRKPLREREPAVHPRLAAIVDKATAAKASERYETAEAFAQALETWATSQRDKALPWREITVGVGIGLALAATGLVVWVLAG